MDWWRKVTNNRHYSKVYIILVLAVDIFYFLSYNLVVLLGCSFRMEIELISADICIYV